MPDPQQANDYELVEAVKAITRERDEARAELARIRTEVLRRLWWGLWWSGVPCVLCGYEGESYYQVDGPHECARLAAALLGEGKP